ncbi:MAG: hypothetical protein WCK81_02310 [Betaproteobacteria bacterium]
MSPSGGLFWHLHAWRQQRHWRAACTDIGQWLATLPPAAKDQTAPDSLVVIGASAGWMLPSAWLQGFERVDTFDLDRWAGPLFRRRHGAALHASGTALACHTRDALTELDAVLSAHPQAVVLFDNVLGQLRFHCVSIDEASQRIAKVTRRMRGRRWGSVHDAYSGPTHPRRADMPAPAMHRSVLARAASSGAVGPKSNTQASQPMGAGFDTFGQQLQAQGPWLDHLTEAVFPAGTLVHHIAWPYSARYGHWLQAGWVAA